MTEANTSRLTSDRPINSLAEDMLGRGSFALALANAISAWRDEESLVLAVYGKWGIGKSSTKNMVLEFLHKAEKPVSAIEFNPWAWTGSDRLMIAFFEEVGQAVSVNVKDGEKLAEKWHRYASLLSLGATSFKYVGHASNFVGVPILPLFSDALEAGAKQSAGVLKEAAEASKYDTASLQKVKGEITTALRSMSQPLLVIMDDVDRLTKEEIRLLFRLVKANADFPNIIFLLMFDRAVVETALDGLSGATGREFMEKIVQVGLDLPDVEQARLNKLFLIGLNEILSTIQDSARNFDEDRWERIFHHGIQPFLATMRDVHRILASFSFTVGLFVQHNKLEVNVLDLIAMEALRIFVPEIYSAIPKYRGVFIESAMDAAFKKDFAGERKKQIDKLLESVGADDRDAVNSLLPQLFPVLGGYSADWGDEWERTLRVCSEKMFPRYFVMTLPEGEIPLSLIDNVVAASVDEQSIRKMMASIKSNGELVPLIDRLEAYKTELDVSLAQNFATALFDVGDDLPAGDGGLFGLSPSVTAHRIVLFWLRREKNAAVRSKALLSAIAATTGMFLPIDTLAYERRLRERDDKSDKDYLLDEHDLVEAQRICWARLESAARDGWLERSGERLGFYLWNWKRLGGDAEARAFVKEMTASDRGTLLFLRGLLSAVHSTSRPRIRWRVELGSVGAFANLADVELILGKLANREDADAVALKTEFVREIAAFREATGRRDKGWADDSLDNPFEEDR